MATSLADVMRPVEFFNTDGGIVRAANGKCFFLDLRIGSCIGGPGGGVTEGSGGTVLDLVIVLV